MSATTTDLASEQAADLAALQASAAGQAAATVPAVAGSPGEPDHEKLAGELAGVLMMAATALAPMFPSLPKIYTQEASHGAGAAIAAVCRKHGWLQGGMFGQWGEEVACAAIVLPLAFATYQGIAADLAAGKASKDKPGTASAPATLPASDPGQKSVIIGAPIAAEAGEGAAA